MVRNGFAMGIAVIVIIISDLERVEDEWDEMTDRRNWRLLTENVARDK